VTPTAIPFEDNEFELGICPLDASNRTPAVPSPSVGIAVGSVEVNVKTALAPPGTTAIAVIVTVPEVLL
jgi:hypothetical protein